MRNYFKETDQVVRRELRRIVRQPMYWVLMVVLPVVSFAFFAVIFERGVARNIPIAVLDEDHTTLSRKVTQMIDDTPTAMVSYEVQSMEEAQRLMREGRISAIVHIPAFFEKNILSNSQTHIECSVSGTNITVIEPIAMKREMAKKLGAVHTIDPVNQDRKEEAMKITDGRGFDVVIEASGSWRACDGIEELVGKGGTLEFFAALYRHDYDYKLNLLNAFFKEIRIVGGVFQSPYAFPRSIALVNTLDLDPILEMDCVFTPEAFEDAFEAQMNGRTIKSLVQFTPDVE